MTTPPLPDPIPPLPSEGANLEVSAAPRRARRCRRHQDREAVAQCLGCGRGVCRECVAEHEGKIYCAPCRNRLIESIRAAAAGPRRQWGPVLRRMTGSIAAFLVVWLLVLMFGRLVLRIPTETHDGTMWEEVMVPAGGHE